MDVAGGGVRYSSGGVRYSFELAMRFTFIHVPEILHRSTSTGKPCKLAVIANGVVPSCCYREFIISSLRRCYASSSVVNCCNVGSVCCRRKTGKAATQGLHDA